MEENLEKLNPYFITGLTDGEGTFTYSRLSSGAIQPYFGISLNIGDLPLIKKVRDFFEVGNLYFSGAKTFKMNEFFYTSGPTIYYRVTHLDDLIIIRRHFLEYPLVGKKRNSFKAWDELVIEKWLAKRRGYCDKAYIASLAKNITVANGNKTRRPRQK